MATFKHPVTGDVKVATGANETWLTGRGFVKVANEGGDLKGTALDEALDAAGLPKTGSADEKRARLAEHAAGQD